jgi:hypothetical protein
MAIHRGIQSAIFYYLSCAPCADARYRKKRKKDAIRGRAERAALHAEMPEVYRQASPSSTNPYWQTEIAAGPVLAARGKKKANATSNSTAPDSRRGLKTSMTQRSNGSKTPSSEDVSLRGGGSSRDGRLDSRWQFQRFQRDDEPWMSGSVDRLASSSTLDGSASGISRPAKVQTRAGEGRNPQISDLHPATVTKISSKEEAKWLMAPPPTADFMSGTDRTARSRSDSGGSRLSSRSGVPLSREVSRRIMGQKMRNGDVPITPPLSRESTMQISSDPTGQRHDRTATDERDFALEDSPIKSSPGTKAQASEDSSASAQTVVRSPKLAPEPLRARKVASRPQLSTIASDSLLPTEVELRSVSRSRARRSKANISHSDECPPDRDRSARRSALVVKDDSLKALQDLAPASQIFKTQIFSSYDFARDTLPKQTRLPSQDASEEKKLEGSPEMFDSWYTHDFQLPEWIHEHTKREVTQRWSMDI